MKTKIVRFCYHKLFVPIVFPMDPEKAHDMMVKFGIFVGKHRILRNITSYFFSYKDKRLEQEIKGIRFPNPVGLAAGFDKNAALTDVIPCIGFGFEEIGSVTGQACEGNPKPRLWRLKESKGYVVYYGLKNDGARAISNRLKYKLFDIPIGTSIAKTNSPDTVDTQKGIDDYVRAFKEFIDIGDYYTINISCPNAFGGEPFTDPEKLKKLLAAIDDIPTRKPIFVKLSPDLSHIELKNILDVLDQHKIDGIICSNLTKPRTNSRIKETKVPEKGGLSGKIVEELSNDLISNVYKKTQGKYIIIGCGGIFSAEDAYAKIKRGASLVQLITGAIYEGPQLISEINQGLVALLKKDGYASIKEAIGSVHRELDKHILEPHNRETTDSHIYS